MTVPAAPAASDDASRRVALVTGGAIRVGRAIALGLARAGLDVAITYRTSDKEAQATVADLRAEGVRAEAYGVDFADLTATADLPDKVVADLGRLDVLVNSASVFDRTPFGEVTPVAWDRQFALNAKAPFFLTQAAAPRMAEGEDPCVVNLLDTSAEAPYGAYLPYGASKGALASLTRGLAKVLAPGIRVNGVAPGPVLPPEDYSKTQRDRAAEATIMGRWGEPEDVAQAVAYLVHARYVTGTIIPVDGGRHLA